MVKRDDWSNQKRSAGFGRLIGVGLALALSAASVTVAAQTTFEFEDPLDQVRAEMQRKAAESGATTPGVTPSSDDPISGWTASAVPTADGRTVAAPDSLRARAAAVAENAGLPVAGLVGLVILGLLALGLGLYWLFSRRGEASAPRRRKDRDLYAVSNGSRARRVLESGAKVTRQRSGGIDTEESTYAATTGVAAKAAKILSNEPLDEDDNDEFVQAYQETKHAPVHAQDDAPGPVQSDAPVDAKNPETWKRPNLDRLKESIREGWKPEQEPAVTPPMQTEAEAFAELFGDDDAPRAEAARTRSPVLDMLDTFEDAPGDVMMSTLRSEIGGEAARGDGSSETRRHAARPPLPSRADAVRRIRALRDSVKAS